MITNKEYPATHSMSTSWYMVDDEGNIGIMQFDDNGPVPYGLESDCSFANNAATGEQLGANGQCGSIRFTEQQIDELLGSPHAPQEEKRWWDVAVKIAPDDEARFHQLVDNSDIDVWCMSEQSGLYMLDASECVADYERVAEGTVLDVLIKQGIIRAVYTIPELEMDCKWNYKQQDVVFTKDFDSAPYYIYLQPYWPDFLQQRMCTPRFPVTIDQVAEEKRHKLLRIPGKFSEMARMQIAQWHACRVSGVGEYRYVGDCTYNLLPTPDGEARYFLNDVWDFDFFPFCPPSVRHANECVRCNYRCATTYSQTDVTTPTVLLVADPRTDHRWRADSEQLAWLKDRMAVFCYVPMIPLPNPKGYFRMLEDVTNELTEERLLELLRSTHRWFDKAVKQINPRAIVLMDRAQAVFGQVYRMQGHEVCIDRTVYPLYLLSEAPSHRAEIEALAAQPYRGTNHALSYSQEEMKEMMQKGLAR